MNNAHHTPSSLVEVTPWGALKITAHGLVRLDAEFGGLRFNHVTIEHKTHWTGYAHEPIGVLVDASVSGPGKLLIRHLFCERRHLRTPPCGFRYHRNADGELFTVKKNRTGYRIDGRIYRGIHLLLGILCSSDVGFAEDFHAWRGGKLRPAAVEDITEVQSICSARPRLRLVIDNTR